MLSFVAWFWLCVSWLELFLLIFTFAGFASAS